MIGFWYFCPECDVRWVERGVHDIHPPCPECGKSRSEVLAEGLEKFKKEEEHV
tara:strand:- start:164 stop:322 length:159 start_codon:yes stop_codon:yes gene_type:complete